MSNSHDRLTIFCGYAVLIVSFVVVGGTIGAVVHTMVMT